MLFSVSANILVDIFRVNVFVGRFLEASFYVWMKQDSEVEEKTSIILKGTESRRDVKICFSLGQNGTFNRSNF